MSYYPTSSKEHTPLPIVPRRSIISVPFEFSTGERGTKYKRCRTYGCSRPRMHLGYGKCSVHAIRCKIENCLHYVGKDGGVCIVHNPRPKQQCNRCNKYFVRIFNRYGMCYTCVQLTTICKAIGCVKVSAPLCNGFCHEHTVKLRCTVPRCKNVMYNRTHKMCKTHFNELKYEYMIFRYSKDEDKREDAITRARDIVEFGE